MNTKRPHLYILQDQTPVPVTDALVWGEWFETADRIVKSDMIQGIHVSTVFIGIDHGYSWMHGVQPGYKPLLFETMVFGGEMDMHQQRYSTWKGAEHGHDKIVERVRENLKKLI
jgi:hypothetical protein